MSLWCKERSMFDRLKRLAGISTMGAMFCAGWAGAKDEPRAERTERPTRPAQPYVQRAYRIIIDTDDDGEVVPARYAQPTAPAAPSRNAPATPTMPRPQSFSVQPVPISDGSINLQPGGHVEFRAGRPLNGGCQDCGGCSDCDACKKKFRLHGLKSAKSCAECACESCDDKCGCSSGKCGKKVKCKEVVETTVACDDCERCGHKLFGRHKCGSCGKQNKCDSCETGDCAPKEPHHFSSGANRKHKECCNPDGSICDNVCNDKGCQREPCPCPSNEVLSYYRCGHYGHYPTFWRSWPTGWLAYRPPVGDTLYDRFKKPQKSAGGDSRDDDSADSKAPESDPELLNRMRARQNRTNNLGEQVPETIQPRRRTAPERVPDADLPDRPKLPPSKAAPKGDAKDAGSFRWNRAVPSEPGIGARTSGRSKVVGTAYIIEEDAE